MSERIEVDGSLPDSPEYVALYVAHKMGAKLDFCKKYKDPDNRVWHPRDSSMIGAEFNPSCVYRLTVENDDVPVQNTPA